MYHQQNIDIKKKWYFQTPSKLSQQLQDNTKNTVTKGFSKNTVNKCMTTGTLCVIILIHIQNNKNNRQWFKLNKLFKQTCYTEMLNNSLNKYSLSYNF